MSEELKITGTVVAILPEETGTSKSSGKEWKKKSFVIETEGTYPKKACFTLFSDKVALIDRYSEGDRIEVKFNVNSNEYSGKYYTSLDAWFISGEANQSTTGGGNFATGLTQLPPSEPTQPDESDLPF